MGNIRIKTFWGKTWMLIYRHSTLKTVSYFTIETAKFSNEDDKFSILGKIDDSFKYNDKYEFLLEYPESGKFCIWRQSKNPLEQKKDGKNEAEGFEPIHLIESQFCGLQYTGGNSLLNGHRTSDGWIYAIGTITNHYSPSFPCHATFCNESNLYLRVKANRVSCKQLIKRQITPFTSLILFLIIDK